MKRLTREWIAKAEDDFAVALTLEPQSSGEGA